MAQTNATSAQHPPAADYAHATAPRIVAIGGGTGLPTVLQGLAEVMGSVAPGSGHAVDSGALTAVVAVTDDGGSSGALRQALGVPPPGDVRNCLAALIERQSFARDLLQYRFASGTALAGHALGNLMLAGLTDLTGNLAQATEALCRILDVRGHVLPATAEDVSLRAEFLCGAVVDGETAIATRRAPIRRLSLSRTVRPLPQVLDAIAAADIVVVGPGSLYTSVLPPLLIDGIVAALDRTTAVRIYVANLMTEPGETDGFSFEDHLNVIRQHTGRDLFDYAIVNAGPVPAALAGSYAERGSLPVAHRGWRAVGTTVVEACPLVAEMYGHKIRHAPADLARAILRVSSRATGARQAS